MGLEPVGDELPGIPGKLDLDLCVGELKGLLRVERLEAGGRGAKVERDDDGHGRGDDVDEGLGVEVGGEVLLLQEGEQSLGRHADATLVDGRERRQV